MQPLRVLVVDDEALARERLRAMLLQMPDIEVLDTAPDGASALAAIDATHVDVLLLDIMMPGIDGLEVASQLAEKPDAPCVVFVTAHDAHAVRAFENHAVDYLVKPIRRERLTLALSRARQFLLGRAAAQRLTGTGKHFVSRSRGALRKIAFEDIRYVQADEKYVTAHAEDGAHVIDETLKSIEARYGEDFLRVHRNCLVARRALAALTRSEEGHAWVHLNGVEKPLEVSRRCLAQVKAAFDAPARG